MRRPWPTLLLLAAAPALAQTQEQRTQVTVGRLTKAPRLLESATPVYPPEARAQGLSGDVGLEITIGADGKVSAARVIKAAGHGFDEAALEAVRKYVFAPAEIDGKPAPVTVNDTLHFVLPKPAPRPPPASARLPVSFEGTVREAGNRKALPGVLVTATPAAGGPGVAEASTDARGHFELALPPGAFRVRVFEANHEPDSSVETVKAGERLKVTYFLRPKSFGLFETVVVGQREEREVTRITLSRQELETTPGSFGDPIRVLQDLPGVARAPLFLGELLIRGSGPNDTGTYIDGIELPLLFHFLAGPSVVNPEFVDKLDFYTGGFGGEYGRAIGGLVDIDTRRPAEDQVHGSASINLLDADAYASVPITPDLSVSAAGRRSYYDLFVPYVLKALGSNEVVLPVYDDYQVRADYHLPDTADRFQLFFFGSDDSLDVTSANGTANAPSITENTDFWRLEGAWLYTGEKLHSKAQLWAGTNSQGSGLPGSSNGENDFVVGAREKLEFDVATHLALRTGLEALWTNAAVDQDAAPPPDAYRPLPGQNEGAPPVPSSNTFLHSDTALWGELTWELPKGVKIIPSLRADGFYQVDHWLGAVDPRLTARWDFAFHGASAVKAAVGLYHEPAYPYEVSPVTGTPSLPLQQAVQTSLGVEHAFTDLIHLEVTGFFNYYSNLAESPGGANATILSSLAGGLFGTAATTYTPNGAVRAVGVEVLLRHQLSRHFYGWLAYTFSYSLLDDPELSGANGTGFHPSPYDERHVLTIVAQYRFGSGWQLGARFRLASGLPYTPPTGATFDADTQSYQPILGAFDSANLPLFQQLDLRVDKEWLFSRWSLGVYLDVQNVYNAQNVEFVTFNYDYSQMATITGIPFLPTVGIQGRF
ncbi:MAG TPA: TonB family protein [Myxococcales bacterium]|nr:TonB family protein [Myxococcales bacterium]